MPLPRFGYAGDPDCSQKKLINILRFWSIEPPVTLLLQAREATPKDFSPAIVRKIPDGEIMLIRLKFFGNLLFNIGG